MNNSNSILKYLKPGIPKRYLLFVAAVVWTFAGGMLLFRGYGMMVLNPEWIWLKTTLSIAAGILFYAKMFSRISSKHIARIKEMNHERPCFFSFFNWKGYMMMVPMMTLGILLRTTGIVSPIYLSVGYIVMGTPLLLSSFRFYFSGFNYFLADK
jgi:hypothetical protein